MTRPDWDTYFLAIARMAAERATCPRLQVGCVIVRDRRFVSSGYNGSGPGEEHCSDVGCLIGPRGGCVRTAHAEANAIHWAVTEGISLVGATVYLTHSPCADCVKLIAGSPIARVVYAVPYRETGHLDILRDAGIAVEERR